MGGDMENEEVLRAGPGILRTRLNPGVSNAIYRYAFATLLMALLIVGSQAFKVTPQAIPAAVPVPAAVVPAVSRHSTLSAEVFQKYIIRNSQRMYPRLSREIVDAAVRYSEKYDLSPILVLAVTAAESQFYPFAVSKSNAKGLMQINPEANLKLLLEEGVFREPADIYDPDRNIEAGCFLLRRFINESPDFNAALDRYLGAESISYKAEIHQVMGKILLLGITEELNRTAGHKIQPLVKVEAEAKDPTR
jgi:soluble lytic murein transglycosylase-like protein